MAAADGTESKSLLKTLVASTVGGWGYGALAALLSHPLDTIKTRKQVVSPRQSQKLSTLSGLYRGIIPAAAASVLFRAVPFTTFEAVTALLRGSGSGGDTSKYRPHSTAGWDWNKHPIATAACGGAAGGLARAVLEFPFEAAKVRAQASIKVHSVWDLLRGFEVTALRNMTVIACFWSFMETSKDLRNAMVPVDEFPRLNAFVAGGGCSAAAWAVIYPFDVIKSNVQAQESTPSRIASASGGNKAKNGIKRIRGSWVEYAHILRSGAHEEASMRRFLYRGFSAGMYLSS